MSNYRQAIITLADDLFAGKISLQQFNGLMPDFPWQDSEVEELVDMITHEPHVGWFLGVSKAQGDKNRVEISQRLEELRLNSSKPAA